MRMFLSVLVAALMILPAAAQSSGQSSNSDNSARSQQSPSESGSSKKSSRKSKSEATSSDQTAASSANNSSSQLSKAEQQFVMKAAHDGLAEVQLGQLASQQASDPQVKQFAQKMVNDHQQNNDRLKQLASKKGVTLPDKLDAKDQAELDRLQKLQGAQFDKAYMNQMVKDHNKDVAAFKAESSKAKDPDLKSFVDQTLSTLEQHDQMAKSTDQQVKGSSAKSSTRQTQKSSQNNPPPKPR